MYDVASVLEGLAHIAGSREQYARAALRDESFAAAWTTGQVMALDQAVEYAGGHEPVTSDEWLVASG